VDGGLKPNIVAPGAYIISCRDDDVYPWPGSWDNFIIDNDGVDLDGSGPADYFVMQGTSMACPHVAGIAALVLQNNPTYTPTQVKNALLSTAVDKGATGWDSTYGHGLVNAYEAIGPNHGPVITNVSTEQGVKSHNRCACSRLMAPAAHLASTSPVSRARISRNGR